MNRIRRFEQNDADVVALAIRAWEPVHDSLRDVMGDQLFDLLHKPNWRAKQQRDVVSVLHDDDDTVEVAEEEGMVVGFAAATIHREEETGEILMLAVDPPTQKRGIGTRLTDAATDWMRESRMPVAFISTGGEHTATTPPAPRTRKPDTVASQSPIT